MLTDNQRQLVIAELKTWIGTPYRGWSCVKGAGVDCGQLIYGVFRACGFLPELDLPKDYSLQVSQHRASTEYVDLVATYFDEITEDEARPGDLAVYKLGHAYAHAAVIVEWPHYIIQAEARHGVSGAHGTRTPTFRNAPRKFFTLKAEYCGGALCQ
jgi:cell wall-associated NlpC family hydrolase